MAAEPLARDRAAITAPTPAPLLVDEREARRMLGDLCSKTMFNLRRSRALPFVKVGSRVMYVPADLAAWVERRKGGRESEFQK
jgi:hypothetical protein